MDVFVPFDVHTAQSRSNVVALVALVEHVMLTPWNVPFRVAVVPVAIPVIVVPPVQLTFRLHPV